MIVSLCCLAGLAVAWSPAAVDQRLEEWGDGAAAIVDRTDAVGATVEAMEACDPEDEGKDPAAPCGHARRFHLGDPAVPGGADGMPGGDTGVPGGSPRGGSPAEPEEATDVQHYRLAIELIPEYDGLDPVAVRVAGVTTIDVRAAIDGLTTFTVDLHADMTLNGVTGNVAGFVRSGDQIIITLDGVYNVGQAFQVAVEFGGYPETGGFGAFQWWTRNGKVVIGTLSEPYYARTWWACKDRLNDKATMQMQCTVPDPMIVATNGIFEGIDALPGGRSTHRWHEINPMAPYLASLAVTDYAIYNLTYHYDIGNGPETMPVISYLYPDHWDAVAGEPTPDEKAGCDEMLVMLDKMGEVFGPYPFLNEKYGIAETGGPGGLGSNMEHQTISSMYRMNDYSDIVAHEMGHHWWGDNVTCGTWHDIWLNEGFASYSECLYRERKPSGGVSSYWSRVNARRPQNPNNRVYRNSIASVGAIFSTNDVYNKGCWVLHMLRHVMGDDAFFQALLDYRAAHQEGFAITAEFAASFSATFGHDLSWFTDQWVMSAGSPRYEWNASSFTLGGQTYLKLFIRQTQNTQGFGLFRMPIDIRVTTSLGPAVHRVWNDDWLEYYVIPVAGSVTQVEFDEDGGSSTRNWILWQSRTQVGEALASPPVIVAANVVPLAATPGQSRVELVFSENIGSFDAADVTLVGDATGPHAPASVTYSAVQRRAIVLFDGLPNDAYTLTVLDDAVLANGKALDGEVDDSAWYDATLLPSGDGQPGGDAVFTFPLLAGDANCDGAVTLDDVGPFIDAALGTAIDACQLLRSDADNSGAVDGADVQRFVDALLGT